MALPEFDGSAEGPRGQPGISPEQIAAAQRGLGLGQDPENSPQVTSVMDRQVERLTSELGIAPPAAQPQAAPSEDTPPPQRAPAQQTPPAEDSLEDRIHRAKEKYPNLDELAKAYVHTDAARTRAQQQRSSEISELSREIVDLKSTMAVLLTPRGDSEPLAFRPPQQGQTSSAQTPEDFFQKPEESIKRIVQETVQENLIALEEARLRREQAAKLDQLQTEKADEIERLKPVMARIYSKNRDIYDGKPAARIMEDLLDRARTMESAVQGAQFYQEVRGIDQATSQVANPQPGPGASSLPSGGGRPATGRQAPIQNFSDTPSMKRLWKARTESSDEMAALTEVLKERGFGEDTKI